MTPMYRIESLFSDRKPKYPKIILQKTMVPMNVSAVEQHSGLFSDTHHYSLQDSPIFVMSGDKEAISQLKSHFSVSD